MLHNDIGIVPLGWREPTANDRPFQFNFVGVERDTGVIEGGLEGLNLLFEFCELSAEIDHRVDDVKWVKQFGGWVVRKDGWVGI